MKMCYTKVGCQAACVAYLEQRERITKTWYSLPTGVIRHSQRVIRDLIYLQKKKALQMYGINKYCR